MGGDDKAFEVIEEGGKLGTEGGGGRILFVNRPGRHRGF